MSSFVNLIDQRRLIGPGGSTVSGDIYFYYTGTSNPAPVYLDVGMTIPAPNPITVGAGEVVPLLFLDTEITYRRVILYEDGTFDEMDPLGSLFSEGEIGVPIATVLDFSGATAPEGFLFCYGQAISRIEYADLFAVIGTEYGAGNGTTTFNIPDYRGRVVAGKDNMGGIAAGRLTSPVVGSTLGATGGEQSHILTTPEMPSHSHTIPDHAHEYGAATAGGTGLQTGANASNQNVGVTALASLVPADTGGDGAHNNVQPTIVANKIIKVTANTFLSLIDLLPSFDTKANAVAIGITPTDTDMGVFTGSVISDNVSAKVALQELEDAVEAVGAPAWVDITGKPVVFDSVDTIVASNDGAGGTLWSTVAGFIAYLRSNVGSSVVGFLQSGTGATTRTVQAKLRDIVSVKDFGAVGDGIVDDRSAIQLAINTGAQQIKFPRGTYKVSGELVVDSEQTLIGENMSGTKILSTDLNSPIIRATGQQRVSISNLFLQYTGGTPVLGASAILLDTCFFCNIRDVWTEDCWNGIEMTGAGNHSIVGYRSFSYHNSGLLVNGAIDINLTNFRLSASDSIKGAGAGIQLLNAVEAFTAVQGDITLGLGNGIQLEGSSSARGSSPWYNKFSQVYCDSTKGPPINLRKGSHNTFTDCWAASGGHDEAVGFGSALDVPGVDIVECQFIKFIGGEFYNNGGAGARVFNTSKFSLFDGVSLKRNQYTRASNGAGIQILSNTTDFMVRDCLFERDADTVTYRMSLAAEVLGGTSDRYNIADNLLGGTTVSDGGAGVNKRVANNY